MGGEFFEKYALAFEMTRAVSDVKRPSCRQGALIRSNEFGTHV